LVALVVKKSECVRAGTIFTILPFLATVLRMSIWSWLMRRPTKPNPAAPTPAPQARGPKQPIPLPSEPSVFECRECHKVFEARRRRPTCPECDSADVELMSA
jgi:hypothetical protein